MQHPTTQRPITCASCEAEIAGTPVRQHHLSFCCPGCRAGGPCICSYDEETTDDERATMLAVE